MSDFLTERPQIEREARRLLAAGREVRSAAIEAVDGYHGYSMEYAASPAFHRSLWDDLEERLRGTENERLRAQMEKWLDKELPTVEQFRETADRFSLAVEHGLAGMTMGDNEAARAALACELIADAIQSALDGEKKKDTWGDTLGPNDFETGGEKG
jgi:hypothetical protein